ncbi:MAG: hypothetical protein KKB62_01755 [Nanoarchaeota archaeon]|nr:hypothetical protein [Nanoarchaeota archaeon]
MKFKFWKEVFLVVIVLLFFISFKYISLFTSAVILFLLFVYSIYYNQKTEKINPGNWVFTVLMFMFSVLVFVLHFFSKQEVSISILALSIISFVGILLILGLYLWTDALFKSTKFWSIIISYAILVIIIVSFFVGAYAISDDIYYRDLSNNYSKVSEHESSTFNYYYFSIQTFYSMSYGDFVPTKISRIFSITETFFGAFLHVIILGWIFYSLKKREF